eukprot:TRINITY_DN4978_c0_g2_i1.p1 TRINITY_DN4978_c0_g2~~TRINITY_DN4978_c0_g2_i1.p1  ORF type:complete len:695 (+),score=101.13 TRINITY_DN4978_c0_g2_i1:49-2133(+)
MSNRHKGFYGDMKAGKHDIEYEEDTTSPDTPGMEPLPRSGLSGFTLGDALTETPLSKLKKLMGPGYTDRALEEALSAAGGSIEKASDNLTIDPQETRMDEGEEFTYEEFLDYYGAKEGKVRWDRAGAKKQKKPKPAGKKQPKQDAKNVKISAQQLADMQKKSISQSPRNQPKADIPRASSTLRLEEICSSQDEAAISPTPSGRSSPVAKKLVKKPLRVMDIRAKGKKDGEPVIASEGLPDLQDAVIDLDSSSKHRMSVVVVGHVDAGKSTIMGHILYKLNLVPQRVIHKFEKESKATGKASFHFAWVLDETEEERDRGVTMDVAVTHFETDSKRITLLDCPGHRDFVANMITGAAQADAAIIVVNAVQGEFETGFSSGGQTKEHIMLLRSVGVSHLIIAINKLDTVGFSKERFDAIQIELLEYLKKSGFKQEHITFIPVAGLTGENLVNRTATELTEWYGDEKPTLLQGIDSFPPPKRLVKYPMRLCVSDVMKSSTLGPTTVGGKLITGRLKVGDKVVFHPSGDAGVVKGIECNVMGVKEAIAGDNIEVGLSGMDPAVVLSIGDVMCCQSELPVKICQKFEATLLTFSEQLITKSFPSLLHLQSATVACSITRLLSRNDPKAGQPVLKPKCFQKGQLGTVEITTSKPIAIELAHEFRDLGRFMLRANGETIAAGIIKKVYPLVKQDVSKKAFMG